jgi:hypothetical protein
MQTAEAFEKEKQEVNSILASGILSRSPNLELLLKYVCEKYFEGCGDEIKEYNIGVGALGRRPEFDQKKDSIVRVEAHRLRKRLKEYYENEGAQHELRIEIPPGRYAPKFLTVNVSTHSAGANPAARAAPEAQSPGPGVPSDEGLQERVTASSLPESLPLEGVLAGDRAVLVRESVVGSAAQGTEIQQPRLQVPNGLSSPAQASTIQASTIEASTIQSPTIQSPAIRFSPNQRTKWVLLLVIALSLAGVMLFAVNRTYPHPASAFGGEIPALLPDNDVRILCGVDSGSYTDSFERTWQSDRYYTGGVAIPSPRNQIIWGTRDEQIYRNRREGNFSYDIPVKNGVYELRLYFAETMFGENNAAGGGETTRLFRILVNGKTVDGSFDVIADAGSPSTADIKVFKDISPAVDGKIHVELLTSTNVAFLNAIAIQPGIPGRLRQYRIAAREHGLSDGRGLTWDPDHYARGGQLIARPDSNVQNADPELFRGERFGNITYSLPVAQPGKYTVNLYFTENWFGPSNPGGGGVGSRVFDILINGKALKTDFDILKEAGGVNRAITVSQHGVEPNHQGKIVISLVPDRNYAVINALEVIDESP